MNSHRKTGFTRLFFIVSLLRTLTVSQEVYGFQEDICWDSRVNKWVNFKTLPSTLRKSAAFLTSGGCRSMIHSDATHYIAQAVGISPQVADWLTIYQQGVDFIQYTPRDVTGATLDSSYQTIAMKGIHRFEKVTAGQYSHHPTPFKFAEQDAFPYPLSGLRPKLDDAVYEGFLYHWRQWGMFASEILCSAGFTEYDPRTGGYYAGTTCYRDPAPGFLTKRIRVEMYPSPTWNGFSGNQILHYIPNGRKLTQVVYASNIKSQLDIGTGRLDGQPVPESIARAGIYLHMLVDRIHKYSCGDSAYTLSPDSNGIVRTRFNSVCSSDNVGKAVLPPNVGASLEYLYDELLLFRAQHPEFSNRSVVQPLSREYVVEKLNTSVLNIADGCLRMKAMLREVNEQGFQQMPGQQYSATLCQ